MLLPHSRSAALFLHIQKAGGSYSVYDTCNVFPLSHSNENQESDMVTFSKPMVGHREYYRHKIKIKDRVVYLFVFQGPVLIQWGHVK